MALEMSPDRRRRLEELGRLHSEWVARHVASTPFRPDGADSDYNVHHVDVEASADAEREFMRRAREIMGLDPETGLWTDAGP
jgi:hypothetical protein